MNADITTYSGGYNYPQHGGTLTVESIPFLLATIGPSQDTAILQPAGSVSIPVGIFGVTSADVLVNSAYGSCGADIGQIVFVGSSETFTYTLTEGVNVRDHFNGGFCNTATALAGTASFGGDRLDMLSITLPAGFSADTLESVDFDSFDLGTLGLPFLAAANVVAAVPADPPAPAVPEPSLVWLSVAGALLALKRGFRRAH